MAGAPVALIHVKLEKRWIHYIVGLFQEDPEVVACFPEEISPRYLVGITKLSGVELTLTKARRIVQLDPEWLLRDEHQARKRINRRTQTGQTYSYSVHFTDSVAESMIFDQQNRRENLMELALDATTADLQVRIVEKEKGE